jgi:hypothetical protein
MHEFRENMEKNQKNDHTEIFRGTARLLSLFPINWFSVSLRVLRISV